MTRWASPALVAVAGFAAGAGCHVHLMIGLAITAMAGHAVDMRHRA